MSESSSSKTTTSSSSSSSPPTALQHSEDGPTIVDPSELGLPSAFGAQQETAAPEEGDEKASRAQLAADIAEFAAISRGERSAAAPVAAVRALPSAAAADDEEDDDEDAVRELPLTHEAALRGHERAVSALAWEPSGARLFSGGHDYKVRLWDFGGMDSRLRSFRDVEPCEGCPVVQLSLSPAPADALFLVATGAAQPKLFTRDAFEVAEFAKGDQYLSDMTNTRGHVQTVTAAQWNPRDRDLILTAALDGTVRLWSPETVSTRQRAVVKAKIRTPRVRAAVTAACWDTAGAMFAAAVSVEGTIQFWQRNGPFHRPQLVLERAHAPGSETSCLRFFADGHAFVSRGGDDTMKFWDLRNPREPVLVWDDLPSTCAQTDCILSPDEEFIVTGTSSGTRSKGSLRFFRRDTFALAKTVEFDSGVNRVLWNERLRQIVVGLGDGSSRILFDPHKSEKGALLCIGRAAPKEDPAAFDRPLAVFVPIEQDDFLKREIPIERQLRMAKRQEKREQRARTPSKNPSQPPAPIGTDGRLGSSTTQFLLRNSGVVNPKAEEDPRDALLRLDTETKRNPFFTRQYATTQPTPIFSTEPEPAGPPPKKKPAQR